jgi:type I restriction enzyme, S subunit
MSETTDYRVARIGDVLQRIDAGWSPLCGEDAPSPGEWGVLKVSAVTSGKYIPAESKTLLPGMPPRPEIEIKCGDLIMCRANGARELVGAVAMVSDTPPRRMLSDKTLRLVADHAALDSRYLYYYLTSWHAQRQIARLLNGSSGQDNISQNSIKSIKIILPGHDRQRRIVEILDSVDEKIQTTMRLIAKQKDLRVASIRQLAADGLACFDGIEASELNRGNRRSNGSWSLVPLGTVLAGIDAGHSPDLEDTPAGPGQWGVLKVSAVGEDGFRPVENKVVRIRGLYDLAICVRRGDLLMTRANTSQLVGRSCIVEDTPPGLMLCDKTLRLRVDERSVPTRYVHIILGLAEVRRQIEIAATGTSGSMKNISQQSIRQLMIPIGSPQDVKGVAEIDMLHEAQTSALRCEVEGLRSLKQGLMDDLLTGRIRVSAG